MTEPPARAAGTVEIAGKKVSRLGFGAMRLTGLGVWGEPEDREECLRVLHRAVDLGVQLIDTADSYGPHVSEEIIREALHPYPEDVLIATKAGLTRYGPDVISTEQGPVRVGPRQWSSVGRPEYLRQQAVMSLRRLGLECIDLFQLHRVDPQVPLEDQVGELRALQNEGKIVAIGLSEVSVDEIRRARQIADIATVQNRYNLTDRTSADVLDYCTREGIGFIPWAPVGAGELARPGGPVHRIATAHEASPSQIALSWLLARSEVILPIPGTSKVTHLEDNIAAASLRLTAQEIDELTDATASSTTRETATAAPSDRHWSSEELAVIGGSDDVLITGRQPDGRAGPAVEMWVVRLGEDVYLRPGGGRDAWLRSTGALHGGRLRIGHREWDVEFVQMDGTGINEAIDHVFRNRYRHHGRIGDKWITGTEALTSTLKVVPRR